MIVPIRAHPHTKSPDQGSSQLMLRWGRCRTCTGTRHGLLSTGTTKGTGSRLRRGARAINTAIQVDHDHVGIIWYCVLSKKSGSICHSPTITILLILVIKQIGIVWRWYTMMMSFTVSLSVPVHLYAYLIGEHADLIEQRSSWARLWAMFGTPTSSGRTALQQLRYVNSFYHICMRTPA